MRYVIYFFILAVVGLSVATGIYVVDQRQYAIVFAVGEAKDVIEEPGLYFKIPAPFQKVVYFDRRATTTESREERITTAEKTTILVNSFVKWRIADPKKFYVSFGIDEQRPQDRVGQIARTALNEEITKLTVHDVVAGDRQELMDKVKEKMAVEAADVGIDIIDVRLKRVDFSEQISNSVYERMKAEQTRIANELRSTGDAESEKIRADADRQKTVILAEAFRDAEKIKGEGDAKAARIYAQAFGQNPEFYRFYRSLEAYKKSFKDKKDVLVVDPSSEFFRYMKKPQGEK